MNDKKPFYFWKKCYEIGDEVHWALCDQESYENGGVTCFHMILFSPTESGIDGKPVSEQPIPKKIVDLLNADYEAKQ